MSPHPGTGDNNRDRYRATPHDQREMDPGYAPPLSDVVDAAVNGDDSGLRQLADDLSEVISTGSGDEFTVEFIDRSATTISGPIRLSGQPVGQIARSFTRDTDGEIVVANDAMMLDDRAKRRGFAAALTPRLEGYYRRSGVDRIEVHAGLDDGGLVWARQGFDWDPARVDESIANIVQRLNTVAAQTKSADARHALAEMAGRFVDDDGNTSSVQHASVAARRSAIGNNGRSWPWPTRYARKQLVRPEEAVRGVR